MTGDSLSKENMLASLHDIRLPSDAAGGMAADLLVSVGLAGLAALLCVALVRLVSQPRQRSVEPSLAQQTAALKDLAPEDRRVALLFLLKRHAPARFAEISDRLYAPETVTLSELEAEVDRLV